jgi:hypothetical protein
MQDLLSSRRLFPDAIFCSSFVYNMLNIMTWDVRTQKEKKQFKWSAFVSSNKKSIRSTLNSTYLDLIIDEIIPLFGA